MSPTVETTELSTYIAEHPEFAECRRGHYWRYQNADAQRRRWNRVHNDPKCTHERISRCDCCGMDRRERAIAYLSRGILHYARLNAVYSVVPGYAAVGRRINPSDIDIAELEQAVMAEDEATRRDLAKKRPASRKSVTTTARGRVKQSV